MGPGSERLRAEAGDRDSPERGSGMERILVVDDEEPMRRLLARILERGGYCCATASSSEEARALLEQERFPLVLCDVNMPGESGLELVREMALRFDDTAVVMVSGVDDPAIADAALKAGAYGYILKPFNVGDILIQVSNALRRRQLELERKRHFQELEGLVNERTSELRQREKKLTEALERLRRALEGVIQALAMAVETRDPYTAGHQQRVARLALAMGMDMGLPSKSLEAIYMAGVVHDVGKISVPAEILSKPTRLTDLEFALIKTHPQVGYEILKNIEFPWPIARMVLQHHEKLDGSGYPQGVRGDEILLEARILTVADVVEAMASHRPYRPALGVSAALEEISGNQGTLYDADAAKACLRLFEEGRFSFDSVVSA